ncbi:MAG: hypothetical protein LQ340_000360 [Diploschistes diacapsis]|nr:MAG: hypothetical protein LQ340_000360 [Diploschistes diacapsis]
MSRAQPRPAPPLNSAPTSPLSPTTHPSGHNGPQRQHLRHASLLAPRFATVNILCDAHNNANPRSAEACDNATKVLRQRRYGLYERLEGVHVNSLEEHGAVLLGRHRRETLVNLRATQLNGLAWAHIASRTIRTVLCVKIAEVSASHARTLVFMAGVAINNRTLISGGVNVVNGC